MEKRTTDSRRRPRVLMIKPAGEVYDHDRVRAYRELEKGQYANIGDMMVHESTLQLMDYDVVESLDISVFDEDAIRRANECFDFAVLRGSNFIHEFMDWEEAPRILDRLEIPVHAIGVGAQSASRRRIELPSAARRVFSAISERCVTIGVRGAYTAQVLEDNGIMNPEVIGCPTMFRSRDPLLRLRHVGDWPRTVAMSMRRETDGQYARDVDAYLSIQKRMILSLASKLDLWITVHGEIEEKAFFDQDQDAIEIAIDELRASGWFTEEDEERMLDLYRNRLFMYQSCEEYDAFLKSIDMTIGYRVHGVLPALARGVPSILVDYDERSNELAKSLDIPLISEERAAELSVRDLLTHPGFYDWQQAYPKHYRRFADYLTNNGILHRM